MVLLFSPLFLSLIPASLLFQFTAKDAFHSAFCAATHGGGVDIRYTGRAFEAGNIVSVSQVAGKNWRNGNIQEAFLELFMRQAGNKKFDRLNVPRVYFVSVF